MEHKKCADHQCLLQVYGAADRGSLYSLTVNVDASDAELDMTEQAALESIYQKCALLQMSPQTSTAHKPIEFFLFMYIAV